MRKACYFTLIFMICVLLPNLSRGQAVLYNQSFEDTASLFQGYVLSNIDKGTPVGPEWSALKDSAWVVRNLAAFNTHAAVATSDYNPATAADDWFITPAVNLGKSSKLFFKSYSLVAGKMDTYEVFVSTTDQTVNGCLFNLPLWHYTSSESASFTGHFLDLKNAGYSEETVYIGFRLTTVSGGGKIAIDDIQVIDDSLQSLASLTFTVDMSKYILQKKFNPKTDTVDIAGNFNSWDGTKNIMGLVAGSDSSKYTITIPGFHDGEQLEFKFRINSSWNDTAIEFPYGGPNRLWTITHDKYNYTAFYNEQGSVSAIPDYSGFMKNVLIYPNPVRDNMTVVTNRDISKVQLLSIIGIKLMEWNDNLEGRINVNTSSLAPGTYVLLFFKGESLIGSRKFIRR